MSGRVLSRITSGDLSQAAVDHSFSFGVACRLLTVYVHFTTAVTEEVTIKLDSKDGVNYDTTVAHRLMDSETCYVYSVSGTVALNEDDKLGIEITNANGLGEVYVTAKTETDYH